ncbi:MAG: hypothetical protein LBN01_01220 [Endomicrobium sp.]|jgi:hypothetical protein|nr:hypothetical protein [Endomicrobium sp.]
MKKIIILLIAVSIMLTSCRKSARLSNSDKKADNKTPSAGAGKGNLPQGTNYKNSSKKTRIDTTKGYLHTTSDFLYAHKVGVAAPLSLLISIGLVYYYRYEIARRF